MAEIVLSTFNAKYVHTAFGLRYLLANLGPLRNKAAILETDIHQRPIDHAETVLAARPRIVGFGVYIWNVQQVWETVRILKRLRPALVVVLGGPEISHQPEQHPLYDLADYVVAGEGEIAFARLCEQILCGMAPHTKLIRAEPPDLASLALPYDLYTDTDLAHRVIYVETTRGCPFKCQFCLSALDSTVRYFPRERVLAEIKRLIDRGATKIKFVDRTFNVQLEHARAVLEHLLAHYKPGVSIHFEIVPDRLQPELIDLAARFPKSALRFEIGIQTFNPEVSVRIGRLQDHARIIETVRVLRERTGVHLHADLIFGLPGETLDSFAAGFDRLVALRPQEIQVGILKRLPGAPIAVHDEPFAMRYNPNPPYEILENRDVSFETVQQMRRFARYWEIIWNSGRFPNTAPLLWARDPSPFRAFWGFTQWLYARVGRTDSIALPRLVRLLFEFLTNELGLDRYQVAHALAADYLRTPRPDLPDFIKRLVSERQVTDTAAAEHNSASN